MPFLAFPRLPISHYDLQTQEILHKLLELMLWELKRPDQPVLTGVGELRLGIDLADTCGPPAMKANSLIVLTVDYWRFGWSIGAYFSECDGETELNWASGMVSQGVDMPWQS